MRNRQHRTWGRLAIVIISISILFYLYLPPRSGEIETLNATVGIEKLDVLCIGASHVQSGINPITLYQEHGIAAYDLSIGSQAPWQSYYYIKEICKDQHPKLIIYDTYTLGTRLDRDSYQDYQTVLNMLGFPTSINKFKAVMASKADSKLNIMLVFPYTYDDIENYPGMGWKKLYGYNDAYMMGYLYNDDVEPYSDVADIRSIERVNSLSADNERYLRNIIEYCQEESIDLILTNTPWPCISEDIQPYFNRIWQIADEYGVPFIDGCCLYEDMGIDYAQDSYGDGGHLNYSGVTKYSVWLGDYLDEHYELPDRRGDEDYSAYENGIRMLERVIG